MKNWRQLPAFLRHKLNTRNTKKKPSYYSTGNYKLILKNTASDQNQDSDD